MNILVKHIPQNTPKPEPNELDSVSWSSSWTNANNILNLKNWENLYYYLTFLDDLKNITIDTILWIYNNYVKNNYNITNKWKFLIEWFNRIEELKNILRYSKPENLELIIKAWIKDVNSLISFEAILRHFDPEKLKLIINAWIKDVNSLILLRYILRYSNPENLEWIINILSNAWIKDPDSIILLRYVLKYSNPENLKLIIEVLEENWVNNKDDIIKSILSLFYLTTCKFINLNNIDFNNYVLNLHISQSKLHELWFNVEEYKKRPWKNNPYINTNINTDINTEISWPFNLIDLYIKKEDCNDNLLLWNQVRWKQITVWVQNFYTINNRKCVNLQLLINKLFAPFVWMTRLIKLKNDWKESTVSVDVNDKKAQEILWYKENTPQWIIDLLRIIYQFIAIDQDRNSCHNLIDNIIFDFDAILWSWNDFKRFDDNLNLKLNKLNQTKKEEVAKILYFFKAYIYQTSKEEIEKLDGKRNRWEEVDLKLYDFWITINTRSMMLNMLNILVGMWATNDEDLKIWKEIDWMVKVLDTEYSKAT